MGAHKPVYASPLDEALSSKTATGASGEAGRASFEREVLDLATDCVFAVDADWRFSYLNGPAVIQIAEGRTLLGKSLWTEFPSLLGTEVERWYRDAMEAKRATHGEIYYEPLATWYEVNASPLTDGGIAVWFRDIGLRIEARESLRRAEERFRLAAAAATDLVIDWDLQTGEITWRESLQSGFGFGDELVTSREWCIEQVHPADRDRVSAVLLRCRETGERVSYECRLRRSDGDHVDVRQTAVVQHDETGEPLRLIIAARDITEWNRAHETIRMRKAQLANIFSQALVGIVEADRDGVTRLVNKRYCEMLGRRAEEVIGTEAMIFTHPDDVEWNRELLRTKRSKGESFQIEKRYVRADGSTVWCRVSVSFVLTPAGEVESTIVVAEDITQQRQAAERLKWASEHDALTGLPNRRAFEIRLQAAALRAMRTGARVGLLLLDLDHFKHVNDSFGHAAGDYLLQEIGDRLTECIQSKDLVARLGGDEFAVLVERDESELDLPGLGAAILRQLERPVSFDARSIHTGVSIGGAVFPTDADSAHELFKRADVALYALKGSGRGGTRMFKSTMLDEALVVASQLAVARSPAFDSSVQPHYQPKVDLASGRIVGFEALLRWHHKIHGVQSPDTIAEAFRDYELASKIGSLIQARVLADIRGWLQQGLPIGCVAINAAPAEFLRDDFADRLLARMAEHGIPSSLVEIEITEHAFLDHNSGFVERALRILNEAGVRIALDDFGTGHSSLSHLRDFPVNVLKIDRSFVENVGQDTEAKSIVSAIVSLARGLSIDVVAEGIETEHQRHVLLGLGCAIGQGFHFGRAMAAGKVPQLFVGSPAAALDLTR